nr:hypothetical protein Iba_chr10eCG5430 [Ipomoea batatas]
MAEDSSAGLKALPGRPLPSPRPLPRLFPARPPRPLDSILGGVSRWLRMSQRTGSNCRSAIGVRDVHCAVQGRAEIGQSREKREEYETQISRTLFLTFGFRPTSHCPDNPDPDFWRRSDGEEEFSATFSWLRRLRRRPGDVLAAADRNCLRRTLRRRLRGCGQRRPLPSRGDGDAAADSDSCVPPRGDGDPVTPSAATALCFGNGRGKAARHFSSAVPNLS